MAVTLKNSWRKQEVIEVLREHPGITSAEIAHLIGTRNKGLGSCLPTLKAGGWIRSEFSTRINRSKRKYRVTIWFLRESV